MLAATLRRCYSFVKGNTFEMNLRSRSRSMATIPSTPLVMFSSLESKEIRHFYEFGSKSTGNPGLKFREKLHLPQLSMGKEFCLNKSGNKRKRIQEINNAHVCIGSTLDGFIFTVPFGCGPEIHATNPFNPKEDLFNFKIPPTSTLLKPGEDTCHPIPLWEGPKKYYRRFVMDLLFDNLSCAKAIFSPSRNIMAICYDHGLHFRTSNSSASCWTPIYFPSDMRSMFSERSNFNPDAYIYAPFDLLSDISFHDGNLLATDYLGNVACIEFDDGTIGCTSYKTSILAHSPLKPLTEGQAQYFYLVESPDGNDLFLVRRRVINAIKGKGCGVRTRCFEVFKLENDDYEANGYRKKWTQIDDLEDIALFISPKSCFSLYASSSNDPNIKGNAIYFIGYIPMWAGPCISSEICVCELEDGKLHISESVDYLKDHAFPPPEWFYQQPSNQS